jgi:Holliday junction resolvasome RuvABC endonuclease subunit
VNPIQINTRYLALHPTTYGFGFAVFEGDLRLIDWGAYQARGDKNQRCLKFIDKLIRRYQPRVVLIESRDRRDRRRSERILRFLSSARIYLRRTGLELKCIPHIQMRRFFEGQGATTKQEIAMWIVELFPELSHYLPPKRKAWTPEHPHMGTFDAIALALTYFNWYGISSEDSIESPRNTT